MLLHLIAVFMPKWQSWVPETEADSLGAQLIKNLPAMQEWKSELVTKLYPTFCISMDCSLSGSSVHGILQARVLEWVAISFSKGLSQPRDRTWVSYTTGRFFTNWATREATLPSNPSLSSQPSRTSQFDLDASPGSVAWTIVGLLIVLLISGITILCCLLFNVWNNCYIYIFFIFLIFLGRR